MYVNIHNFDSKMLFLLQTIRVIDFSAMLWKVSEIEIHTLRTHRNFDHRGRLKIELEG